MKYIWPLLFVLTSTYALDSVDQLQTRILKLYDKNIIVLNRGLEDGIEINDHIKITDQNGFIARGLCIKRGVKSSHFKIYRVTNPQLVSKDVEYLLLSINQSQIPKDIEENYKNVDFSSNFEDWSEKDLEKQLKLQQKRFASFDFPKDTSDDSIFKKSKKSKTDQFIAKNFDSSLLTKDFKKFYFDIFASPFATESLNNQSEMNLGLSAYNRGDKYDYSFNYSSFERKSVDPFTKDQVERERTEYQLSFEIKDIAQDWSFINMYRYENSKYSDIGNPRSHTQLGLFGFKYKLKNNSPNDFADITYQFFLDQRQDDVFITGVKDPQNFSLIRHGLRLRLKGFINDKKTWMYFNELWWQPAMDSATKTFNFDDNDTFNRLRVSLMAASNFYIDFENHYSSDINQQKLYGLDAIVITNIINFRYQFKL